MDKKFVIKTRKLDKDSINKKIKNSYFNMIIKLLNHLLELKQRKDLSFRLLYIYKKKVSKKCMEEIQNKKIKDIIIKENKHNQDIDNKMQKDEKLKIISNVLDQDFLYFFDKIYFQKRKSKYNLNEFGLGDFEFDLPENICPLCLAIHDDTHKSINFFALSIFLYSSLSFATLLNKLNSIGINSIFESFLSNKFVQVSIPLY